MDIKTFFKKIIGTVEQEVKTEVNRAKNTAKQQVRSTVTQAAQPTQSTQQAAQPNPQPQQSQSSWEDRPRRSDREWLDYFRGILTQEFGQYAVRENVPVQELAGDVSADFQLYPTRPQQAYKAEWGMPYTFVLYQADSVRGVILLGKYQNHSRRVKFLISKMYAKKMGIPFISFYMDAPNDREYVVQRIKSYVR